MARDLTRLTSALRAWLPDGESLEAVVPLSAGHSNETYLLAGLDRILRTPPSEAGLLPPYDMSRQFRIMDRVGRATGGLAKEAEAPGELLDLLQCLADDPPPVSGPVTPLHGDAKLANCLWQDGRLTALLDWEMAGVGEPLIDLGYLLWTFDTYYRSPESPGWWTREQVIARWEERTGRTARGLARHEVLGMTKIIAILAAGAHLVKTGKTTDPRFAAWGAVLAPMTAAASARLREAG